MKKIMMFILCSAFLAACNNSKDKKDEPAGDKGEKITTTTPADLPYTASYSSSWSTEVSDADLKMVLMTYKDWENSNMDGLGKAMGDSVWVDFGDGSTFNGTNAELIKRWSTLRDSLSSVTIDMGGWHKMYATDKKDGYVVTWYKEIDTYKTGKVDSAVYHDINQVKNGKITWYSQYKRPLK